MGLWLGLDIPQKTRWQCSRRLLAGGGFVRLEGRRMLSCWLRELFLTPWYKLSTLLPEHACGMWDFHQVWKGEAEPQNYEVWYCVSVLYIRVPVRLNVSFLFYFFISLISFSFLYFIDISQNNFSRKYTLLLMNLHESFSIYNQVFCTGRCSEQKPSSAEHVTDAAIVWSA